MSTIQMLQGMPLPDLSEAADQYKNYIKTGNYTWHQARSLTIIIPWFRYSQAERVSRWRLDNGKYKRATPDSNGTIIDVPTALSFMRMLFAPAPVKPGCQDPTRGQCPTPPELRIAFVDLHEPAPIKDTILQTGRVREENFFNLDMFSYFLNEFEAKCRAA